ncbi:chemotaxis protein CheYIII [Paramagnetospirillum magnetotacticum MS-1]|uniref:Chemotaxis protein CheYIII n=1 Tax=Paramagnetospirillum magnetotacticum MS-1 TaxID=272627 RepID=A0A0C2YTH8_PARME|nr:response regulator transcription factor [Paramagnetospirillum magnetotacticum]KIL98458.1 chemotaxis protein CheYIII [Paramagnetospirillum magnetotacticum MS-1]
MTDDAPGVRTLLRNLDFRSHDVIARTLGVLGCRNLLCLDQSQDAEHHLRTEMVDLLVVDTDLGMDEACDLVRRMRRRLCADNAFAVTVLLTSATQPELSTYLLNSGADVVLAKPVDPVMVAGRITALIRQRRSFVVAGDYLGPDRRTRGRRPAEPSVPRIPVPNPLREMSISSMSRDELRERIRVSWVALDECWVDHRAA